MSKFRILTLLLGTFYLTACSVFDRSSQSDAEPQPDRVSAKKIPKSDSQSEESMAQEIAEKPEAAVGQASGAVASGAAASGPAVTPIEENFGVSNSPTRQDLALLMIPSREIEPLVGSIEFVDPTIRLCEEVGRKLGSVSIDECLRQNLVHSAFTMSNRSLAFKDYLPYAEREPLGRVFVIGGIHGDEFSSVSVIIKWMGILNQHHSGLFHWRFVPTANPDGLLEQESQRQNRNGVDLNRNFPTADWDTHAHAYWDQVTKRNPRRHPGARRASELETQWLVRQIIEFKPDVIISLHAPYHLVDYDGPPSAPAMLGGLYLRQLGVYPGSLGNYAGIDLKMPIVTVELKSAGIMPSNLEINRMWIDLVHWLRVQLSERADLLILNPAGLELTSPGVTPTSER